MRISHATYAGGIQAFRRTVAHFWPEFSAWLEALPDTRFAPFIEYDKRFLVWWGLLLFGCKLGSRRQLDFELRDAATQVAVAPGAEKKRSPRRRSA